jgi:RHS repeat-associated protein
MSTNYFTTKEKKRTEYTYESQSYLGRVSISCTNVKQFADGTIDCSEAQELKYVYDARGNVVKTIFADGTEISATYNEQGQKISETNQLGQTRSFEYDIKGHLVAVILPAVTDPKTGKSANPRYEYQYDNFGRQILIRDPNGGETQFEYDAFGNQVSRTLPLGFGVDGILGTADDTILPEGDFTEQNIYDDSGRLIKQVSFEGVVTTFTYDDQGRVTSKTFFESQVKYFTNTPSQTWTYTYDSQGRVTCIDQNGRKTETTYDIQGRTTSIKTPEGTVFYEYDKFGRQIHVYSDKDDDIRYEYYISGRLNIVTDTTTGQVTSYEYNLVGNLAKTITQTSESRLIATYEYDNMNRLVKLTNYVDKNNNGIFDNGEGVSQFDYTLDNLGRKDYAIEKFWTKYGLQENEIDWEYDEAGQLIYEKFDHYNDEFDQTSEWIYDLVGNRLKQIINGTITTYNYDVNDRLLNEVTDDKTTIYGYDHTQQTSKIISENGEKISETTFEYDLQGRMAVVTIIAGNRTEIIKYEYGADGIRVSAEHEIWEDGELKSKTRIEYLNDTKSLTGYSQVLRQTEYDADGNIVKETSYVIGHQRISQTVTVNGQKTTHYFTFDGHGSTRVLLDAAIAIAQIFAFDAYGNAIGFATSEALTEFLYSGEQFDSKIGQQYLRQRYYDPVTGRFNRLDPFFGNLNDPQSFHKYLYTHADPINGIDPTGEALPAVMAVLGGLIGAGMGYWQTGTWQGAVIGAAAAAGATLTFMPAITATTTLWGKIGIGVLAGTVGGGVYGSIYSFATSYFINGQGLGESLYDGLYDGIYSSLFGGVTAGIMPVGGYVLGKTALSAGSLLTHNVPAIRAVALEYILAANLLVRQPNMAFSQAAKTMPVIRYIINPRNNQVKGQLGEFAGDALMEYNGYYHLGDGLYDGVHGLDSIFLNQNTNRLVIHESKYRTFWSAASNPEELLGRGYGYKQMSDDWISVIAGKMREKTPELADKIDDALDLSEIEKTMSVVTKDGCMFLYYWKDNVWELVQ